MKNMNIVCQNINYLLTKISEVSIQKTNKQIYKYKGIKIFKYKGIEI